jgi:hypothetical protein
MLTVSRNVIELNREFHPDGKRFLVKQYPKDKEYRRLKLSLQITAKLKAHMQARGLESDALLFARRAPQPAPLRVITDPGNLGLTTPNEAGRQYRHGTLSAYTAGKCRCEHCRRAFADYRARHRAAAGAGPGRGDWRPRASTSAATGSVAWSGGRPARPQAYLTCRGSMTCGTRIPHGCK